MQAAVMMRARRGLVKAPPERKAVVRALVKERAEPGLWMADVPVPVIGDDDALVRVRRTSICGTDLHIWGWDRWSAQIVRVPMVIGHECMGEVAALGADVAGLHLGQRVAVEGHVPCGACRNCRAGRRHLCHNVTSIGVNRDGCFAEYVAVPAANLFPVPDLVPDDVASLLDPLGNAVHSALSFDLVGEDVLVTGAGPIGIMAATIARFVGARHVVITDVNEYRLDLARRMGVTRAVDVRATTIATTMSDLGMTEGFDVGMEMSGTADGFRSLIGAMNHGGRVALLGLPSTDVSIDLTQVIVKGLLVKGIYGRELFETWYKMVALLRGGLDVSPVVTHRFAVAGFADAFDVTRSGLSGKVVLDWDV